MKPFDKEYINLTKEFSLAWFKSRDQRSVLGFFWSFLNPLIMTAILFFLFKSRMGFGPESNYFLYILIGTVIWNFFTAATSEGLASILERPGLVKNTTFPKEILVFSSIGTFLIQHIFELLTVSFFMVVLGVRFSMQIILLPFIIGIEVLLITGVSLILSCLYVYAFDLRHIWRVITRMAFFVTPVFYKTSEISPQFRWLVSINPMSQIMIFSRDVLLYHRIPSFLNLILVFIFCALVLIAGYKVFKHYEYKIVEKV